MGQPMGQPMGYPPGGMPPGMPGMGMPGMPPGGYRPPLPPGLVAPLPPGGAPPLPPGAAPPPPPPSEPDAKRQRTGEAGQGNVDEQVFIKAHPGPVRVEVRCVLPCHPARLGTASRCSPLASRFSHPSPSHAPLPLSLPLPLPSRPRLASPRRAPSDDGRRAFAVAPSMRRSPNSRARRSCLTCRAQPRSRR